MLNSQHITALNDLTDNCNLDVLALTETWICLTSTPAELIDATPPSYSFFVSRSSSFHPSKLISAGSIAFLLKKPVLIHNFSHSYSSFEYSSITLKLKKLFTLFNIYRPPPPSLHSQPFSTFLNQFSSFLSNAATIHWSGALRLPWHVCVLSV